MLSVLVYTAARSVENQQSLSFELAVLIETRIPLHRFDLPVTPSTAGHTPGISGVYAVFNPLFHYPISDMSNLSPTISTPSFLSNTEPRGESAVGWCLLISALHQFAFVRRRCPPGSALRDLLQYSAVDSEDRVVTAA